MPKFILLSFFFLVFAKGENPKLNQDIIFEQVETVKLSNGESCEKISEKKMLQAKEILHAYWKETLQDSTWANYNRQYMLYNSHRMGTVVFINGACLEKPAEFYKNTWCLGMADAPCYYMAFIDLKDEKVLKFEFNTYKK